MTWKTMTLLALSTAVLSASGSLLGQAASGQAQPAATRAIGTVKTVGPNTVALTPDGGPEIQVLVPDGARMVRVAPGQKDLKGAVPIQLQEIQAGDRILVRGAASPDGKSFTAGTVILMKQEDVAQRQQREREDWQKRGAGGMVTAVDPATGTVTISNTAAEKKTLVVRTTQKTILRRYAAGSVRYDDAQIGNFDQIKPGDQLRARGARNEDGGELTAEEIISGSFRNIAGTVSSVDAAQNSVTVMDLMTKKLVTVAVTRDSQLHKLPPMVAQRMALRLRGDAAGAPGANGGSGANGTPVGAGVPPAGGNRPADGPRPGGMPGTAPGASGMAGGLGNGHRGGSADLQQILNMMPAIEVSGLLKGDAVMIVATPGASSAEATAITLLSGVEPILTAPGNRAMTLSPWNLGDSISDAMSQQ